MKVLISDIAERAGVSSGTVSNAINNRKGVSQDKKQEIVAIATEMGYFEQREVVKKDEQKIKLIIINKQGNVVGDTPFFSELIRGIELECRLQGYELLISHLTLDENENIDEVVRPDQVAGILLLGTELEKKDLEVISHLDIPLVILDTVFKSQDFDFVAINNIDSSYKIVESMIAKGHKDIGLINSSFQINNFRERRQGYVQALLDHNLIQKTEALVEPTLEGAYKDMKLFLDSMLANKDSFPTAFFAVNDDIAIGAMKAIDELLTGKQISMVGFDDIPLAEFCSPPLTTVKVNKMYLGSQAVRRLVDKIELADECHVKILVGTTIVERKSIISKK